MPGRSGATLRTDLQDFAGRLHLVVHLKTFAQIAGHRLFDIDVLAGIERGERGPAMPGVLRRDGDGVDVFSFEQFFEIFEGLAIRPDNALGFVLAMLGKIAGGYLHDVVFRRARLLGANMSQALFADANVADDEPAIGPDDTARRGRLGLAIDGCLEEVGAGRDRSRSALEATLVP